MSAKPGLATSEELLAMRHDGLRHELVDGELKKMAPAGHVHGKTGIQVTLPLAQYVAAKGLGQVYAAETGFILRCDPDTVRAPDVSFVCHERVRAVGDTAGYWPGAPDLAIEVVSPSDRYGDIEEKVFEWLGAGTLMVVVVNLGTRSVTVYRSRSEIVSLTHGDILDGGDVVPGWSMPVRDIFA